MSFPAELEYCGGKVGGIGRPNAGMAPPHHRAPVCVCVWGGGGGRQTDIENTHGLVPHIN